jgi:hypothetical protein
MAQTARVNSRLINDSFSKSQQRNFLSWLTISLLGGSWQRHVGVRHRQLQAQQLSLNVGAFSSDLMEVLCLHQKLHGGTF